MHRERSSSISVGIPLSKLCAHSPRGVVRVARAIAERLAFEPSLRLFAVSEPFFERNDIVFEAWNLNSWLYCHPMRLPEEPLPPASRPPRQAALSVLKTTLTCLGLRRPARATLQVVRSARARLQRNGKKNGAHQSAGSGVAAIPLSPQFRSLAQFDAMLSFECYDSIWDWPTELYACAMIGFFFDAIPFRIDEGLHGNPGAYYRALGKMVNRAGAILCDSQSCERDLHAFFPHSEAKTEVVYLGHDRERFLPAQDSLAASAPETTSKARGRRVAMIGEIEPRKNQASVLRAARYLAATDPSERITLVLIGKASTTNEYEFLKQNAAKYVDIEYLGYVADDQIGEVLRSCDAFLYPSLWEGFGIPVLEAMSAGVPVVCSKNSSLPEVAGPFAFYCDPYDPRSIAESIRRALEMSGERRREWVEQARSHASNFTWSKTARQTLQAVRESAARDCARLNSAGEEDKDGMRLRRAGRSEAARVPPRPTVDAV